MKVPYACETKPLMHHAFLHGRADHRARRPPRPRAAMSPSAARAYFHGYHGHRWRRLPSGGLHWDEGEA
jgi:hypothetical protein